MYANELGWIMTCLESARSRPAMYFGEVDPDAAMHFLNGLDLSIAAWCNGDDILKTKRNVVEERGWSMNSMGIDRQAAARGRSAAQIIDELLVIEIELLRRLGGKPVPFVDQMREPP